MDGWIKQELCQIPIVSFIFMMLKYIATFVYNWLSVPLESECYYNVYEIFSFYRCKVEVVWWDNKNGDIH